MHEWLNSVASQQEPVADCTEHGRKFSGFIKIWKYFDKTYFSSITNNMQRYTIYLFLRNALHISGGSYAHQQELRTVYTS